jgi:predicted nucleotidyltransferase
MKPSEALAAHREEALAIIAKYPVSNPRVFGSLARGDDVEGSDIDLVVDPEANLSYFDLARLEDELRALLGHPLDVGIYRSIKADILPDIIRDLRPL